VVVLAPRPVISFLRDFVLSCRACLFGLRWGDFVGAALLVEGGFEGVVEPISLGGVNASSAVRHKVVFVGAPPPGVGLVGGCCVEALALGVDEGGRGLAIMFRGENVTSVYRFGSVDCGSAGVVSRIMGVPIPPHLAGFTRAIESAVTMFPPPQSLMRDYRFVGLSAIAEDMGWRRRASRGLKGIEEVINVLESIGERVTKAWGHVARVEARVSVEGVKGYVVVGDDGSKLVVDGWVARPARYGTAAITQELLNRPSTAYVVVILEEGGVAKAATTVAGPAAKHSSRKLAATLEELTPGISPRKRSQRHPPILTGPHHPPNIKLGLPREVAVKVALKAMKTLIRKETRRRREAGKARKEARTKASAGKGA